MASGAVAPSNMLNGRKAGSDQRNGPRSGERQKAHKPIHVDSVHPDLKLEQKTPGTKDAVVILMLSASGVQQHTICRPIGTVKGADPKKDFVIVPSHDVKSYVVNEKNPRVDPAIRAFNATAMQTAVEEKIFLNTNGVIHYPDGTNREEILKVAREKRDAHNAQAKTDWALQETREGRTIPLSNKPAKMSKADSKLVQRPVPKDKLKDESDFYSVDVKKFEDQFADFKKNSPKLEKARETRDGIINSFETTGGPDGTARQTIVKYLNGVPPDRVIQTLTRRLKDLDTSFQNWKPEPLTAGADWGDEKSDSDDEAT